MFKLVSDRSTNGRDMRLAVVQTIQDLMKTNDKIVALEAYLGVASSSFGSDLSIWGLCEKHFEHLWFRSWFLCRS